MVRVYCVCLDGAPPNLLSRLARDGTLPNLDGLLSGGSWSRALPSLPTVTSVNWTTMVTGLHGGTHGRPRAGQRVKYFWEAAEDLGIPVGLANIEHCQTASRCPSKLASNLGSR
jgi:predicted AlkP superfamily phosphohydrolase/phosphomutase